MIQINRHPSRRDLRLFAGLFFPGFWTLAAYLFLWRRGLETAASWVVGAALAISLVGLLSPSFMRIVYLAMVYVTYPIGFALSHVLLGIVYYLVLTPIGLLMRLLGNDPMKRDADPDLASYWIDKEPTSGTDRYFRQY